MNIMNVMNWLLPCYIMIVVHFPYRNNTNNINTLAVPWPIIFWIISENKPLILKCKTINGWPLFFFSLKLCFAQWY